MANQKVVTGDLVTFECIAIGYPQPVITWFINAELLRAESGWFQIMLKFSCAQ